MTAALLRKGKAAEFRLISELTERGYPVAIPLVDDDGVDLVVNYELTVQVKSASKNPQGHYQFSAGWTRSGGALALRRHEHVHLFALYGWDEDVWWLVPASNIAEESTTIGLSTTSTFAKYAFLNGWKDAWYVFEFNPVELRNLAGERERQEILHRDCYCDSCKRAEREEIFLKLLTTEEKAC